ncbi:MAG TPA: hypothetical protein VID48_11735 [Solirubrobacteraceae bacterium]|jgi:hypothetical protein
MISSDLLYLGGLILATLIGLRVFLPLFYRRGRQVEFRLARGTGTGEVIGLSGLRLRVRSLSSGHEHTVSLNNVRRR